MLFEIVLFLSGDNSDTVPPDSISNSEVKRISGDGSVGFPYARVAHRQTPNTKKPASHDAGFLLCAIKIGTRDNIGAERRFFVVQMY